MDTRTLTVEGRSLRVATSRGRPGSPPLLFFNGIGANLDLIGDFADALEPLGIGIVIFDIPGTGGSEAAPAAYRLPALTVLANDVLVSLGIESRVDVLGVSWGGGLAQEFVHRYPLRVRRLILAATTAGSVALPGRVSALFHLLSPRRYVDSSYMGRVSGQLYGGKLRRDPQLLDRYRASLQAPRAGGYYRQILAGVGWTSAHWLHTVRAPTLVMVGSDDPIVPPANGRLLASLIPGARLVTIDDGHLFLVTSASECAPIIADFLAPDPQPSVSATPGAE